MPIEEKIEASARKISAWVKKFAAMERTIEDQRALIADLEEQIFLKEYRIRPVPPEGWPRCDGDLPNGHKCHKMAVIEGLCTQHFDIAYGHHWKWKSAGQSICTACGEVVRTNAFGIPRGDYSRCSRQKGKVDETTKESTNSTGSQEVPGSKRSDGRHGNRNPDDQRRQSKRGQGKGHRQKPPDADSGGGVDPPGGSARSQVPTGVGRTDRDSTDPRQVDRPYPDAVANCVCGGALRKHGHTRNGCQRFRYASCGASSTNSRNPDGEISRAKLRELRELFRAGQSARESMESSGLADMTVRKYFGWFELLYGPRMCACGQPMKHRGWCSVRYAKSPKRQEFMKKWHKKKAHA